MAEPLNRVKDIADVPEAGFKSEKRRRKEQKKLEELTLVHIILNTIVHPKYFIPNIAKLNREGQRIWKTGKNGDYVDTAKHYPLKVFKDQEGYNCLFDYPAEKFSTEQGDLNTIDGEPKKRLDMSKKFFNSKKGSLWFHPEYVEDRESEMYGSCPQGGHYHFICELKPGCKAAYKDEEVRNFRCSINRLDKDSADVPYICKTRTVGNNVALMKYVTDGHLLHMGTLDGSLLNHVCAAQEYIQDTSLPVFQDIKEDVQVTKHNPDEDPFPDSRLKTGRQADKGPTKRYGRHMTAKSEDDSDSDSDSEDDMFAGPAPKKPDIQLKAPTKGQKQGNVNFQNMMALCKQYPHVRKWVDFKYMALNGDLDRKSQDFVQQNLQNKNTALTFSEVRDIMDQHMNLLPVDVDPAEVPEIDDQDNYMNRLETVEFLEMWAKLANVMLLNLLLDTYLILRHKIQRRNTLVLQGEATSGKSMFTKGIIAPLYPRVTPQSCDGGETRFIYEKPADNKDNILLFNEFTANLKYLERDKNVMEGTETVVDRKGIPAIEFSPRPVLIACNEKFWEHKKLSENNKLAFTERCLIYPNMVKIEDTDWLRIKDGKFANPNALMSFIDFADRIVDTDFVRQYIENEFKIDDSFTTEMTLENFKTFIVDSE